MKDVLRRIRRRKRYMNAMDVVAPATLSDNRLSAEEVVQSEGTEGSAQTSDAVVKFASSQARALNTAPYLF